jgi:hypothetical protein
MTQLFCLPPSKTIDRFQASTIDEESILRTLGLSLIINGGSVAVRHSPSGARMRRTMLPSKC